MDQTKKELIVFTAGCFIFLWIPCGLFIYYKEPMTAAFGAVFGESVPPFILLIFGAYSPSWFAFVLTAYWGGRSGLKEFLARSFRWRVHWKWWVIAFTAIPGAFLVRSLVLTLFGVHLDLSLWFQALPLWILAGHFFTDSGPLGEEFGIRGYALPRLLKFMSPLSASVLIGALWGLWHLPAFYSSDINPAHAQANFFVFMAAPIAIATLMTWIHVNTRGSVLLSGLIPHMMANSSGAAGISDSLMDASALVVWAAMGLVVYLVGRSDLLSNSKRNCYIGWRPLSYEPGKA